MKRLVQILVFTITFIFTCLSYAGIANTVHNMSSLAPHTGIKAKPPAQQPLEVGAAAEEICIFCHIPHRARPEGRPLWNHDMPAGGYTMYTSEYLHRAGYTVPTGLGTTTGTPGMLSRQCLSCHDGTVAIGDVYAVRGTVLGTGIYIAMTRGGADITTMPPGASLIGTDLTKHHPVGIEYTTTISPTKWFDVGTRTIELLSSPISPLKLYAIGANNYVECSSCHDPHLENAKFLRVTTGANLAAKISTTCTSCHDKIGWSGSIHQSGVVAYNYVDGNVATTFGTGAMSNLVCMNCHKAHKGLGTPYLLRQQWSRTCFQGAGGSNNECHATALGGKTNSIANIFGRAYKHPIVSDGVSSSKHTNLDVLYPTDPGKGLQWSDSKHAECFDCHNPHRAKNTPARVGTASWYPTTVDNTSNQTAKSGALTGVTGVEPGSAAKWTVPTTFTTQEAATYEYQICFKCHSYWALRDGDGITTYTSASGATITDQAMEFNPNNYSAHPVVVTLNNQTGSYAPKPLTTSQMSSPWATNLGNQTMYCSDCHGTDNETSGDPKGPHGANVKYLLKGTNKYWPTKSDYATMWTLNDVRTGGGSGLFCLNCHPIYGGGAYSGFFNYVHSRSNHYNYSCVTCHIVIPHGGKRSRLIGYNNADTPSPYNYNGNSLKITQFKKTSPGNYTKQNCQAGCYGGHNMSVSGADP